MLKKLKLGHKIAGGFGGVLLILLIIGVLSIVSMKRVASDSAKLSGEYAPEVEMATDLERYTHQTMYNMLGFNLTDDASFLQAATSFRDSVTDHIEEVEELAGSSRHLLELKKRIDGIKEVDRSYEASIQKALRISRTIDDQRTELDRAAKEFVTATDDLLTNQSRELKHDIRSGAGGDKLENTAERVVLLDDVIKITNTIRLDTWKAQARRNPEMLKDSFPLFDDIENELETLKQLTNSRENRAHLDTIETEVVNYKLAMEGLYKSWHERDSLVADQRATGDSLLDHVRSAAMAGTENTVGIAQAATSKLNASTVMLIGGLVIALLLGIIISVLLTRNIVTPITVLTEGAQRMAVGDVAMADLNEKARDRVVRRSDELGDIGKSFRALTEYMSERAEVARRIGEGDLDAQIEKASAVDTLSAAMIQMRDSLNRLVAGMQAMYREQKAGDIEFYMKPSNYSGVFAEVATGYNEAVKLHVDNILKILNLLGEYAEGGFEKRLEKLPGKQVIANEIMDKLRDNLQRVVDDTNGLVMAALEGDLGVRADAEKHGGQFREIIQGINDTLNAVIEPVQEAAGVLERMAEGDLSRKMEGNYKGDHATIKMSLNGTLASLNDILEQVRVAVEQVNSGAVQVSDASQSLSQGATEQASSLEEVSSSMAQIGSQVKLNADNATQANQLSTQARRSAEEGDSSMQNMLSAMEEIDDKSTQIQKIIKVIDEIAFQTNLLALNAAVEAARAGVHGKGFAVVAEEVRNLAQRSASAARETTELIEGNVASVKNGSEIAERTAASLKEIMDGITKVTDLNNEIASASREQASGVEQITQALGQIDQVTQSNTANAEQSAAAAEELSGQSTHLNEMLRRFVLVNNVKQLAGGSAGKTYGSGNGNSHSKANGGSGASKAETPRRLSATTEVNPDDIIRLDDAQFEGF